MEVDRLTQQAVAQALHAWALRASGREGARFLRQARELRRLRFELASFAYGDEGGVGVYRALGMGAVGAQLRSLYVPGLSDAGAAELLVHLKAGRMPCLTELGVVPDGWGEQHRVYPVLTADGAALVDALQARSRDGLPPMTRITGIAGLETPVLRRVWACCPAGRVTHLEAQGAGQVWALGQYMLEHADFWALRTLRIMGNRRVNPEDAPLGGLGSICDALAQGRAPGLEEMTLDAWETKLGRISEIGRVIGDGALPKLASLSLLRYSGYDFRGLVNGLCKAPQAAMRRLRIHDVALTEGEASHLAKAVEEGKGLSRLEVLEWPYDADRGSWVLDALVRGAPCARTLRTLHIDGQFLHANEGRVFLQALGENALPCLQKLTLEGDWLEEGILRDFSEALVRLVERGTPSPMKTLILDPSMDSECQRLDALTSAFAAGGLPWLTHLHAPIDWRPGYTEDAFLQEWTALGPRIRLEAVRFHLFDNATRRRLLEEAANPAFLPFLSSLSGCCNAFDVRAKATLDRRGLARLGMPTPAIAVEEEEYDSHRYLCNCGMS